MKSVRSLLFFSLAALALAGCRGEYRDITTHGKYSHLANQAIRLNEDFIVHAVTMPGSPPRTIDEYHITSQPGFGGREVAFRKTLQAGTVLRVLKIEECTNCLMWGFERIHFVVEAPEDQYADHRTLLAASFGGKSLLGDEGGRAVFRSPLVQLLEAK